MVCRGNIWQYMLICGWLWQTITIYTHVELVFFYGNIWHKVVLCFTPSSSVQSMYIRCLYTNLVPDGQVFGLHVCVRVGIAVFVQVGLGPSFSARARNLRLKPSARPHIRCG